MNDRRRLTNTTDPRITTQAPRCTIDCPEMSFEHLLNADFDLSLRPRWRRPEGPTARRRITDLAWHALFLADPNDSVLVPETAPGDFLAYLERAGITVPTLTVEPDHRVEGRFSPFGWNSAAVERNLRYGSPVDHPPIDVVTRVNGRRFSARLEEDLFGTRHAIAEIRSEAELGHRLEDEPSSPGGWLVKAEHGNAALGNRRLRSRTLNDGDLTAVRRLLEEDGVLVLERWLDRERDLCVTFSVSPTGKAVGIAVHESVTTADGALIGGLFEDDPAPLAEWRPALTETAERVADRLAEEGYFGPACVDAFVWNDAGESRLRPLVDLNARREISAGASALWRRLGGSGAAYWRFFTRRKLRLPDSYRELEDLIGEDVWDADTRTGLLVTSPLWLGAERRAPAKAAMLLFGRSREDVFGIDRRLRERLER